VSRPDAPGSVYLDSCSLIQVLIKGVGYEPIERVLQLADAGRVTVLISPMSLVEVRGQPNGARLDKAKEDRARQLLDNPRFVFVEFDRHVSLKARDLAMRMRMKNADAVHLASAIAGAADALMTCDKGFPRGQLVEGVWVDEPYMHGGPDLFGD
jgi:predicted nucleic acid-binding protein